MLNAKQLILMACASLCLVGCGDEITAVIEDNAAGLNSQDISKVMSTIDTHSEIYASTKSEVDRLIKNYDLEVVIESIKVIKAPREENSSAQKEEKAQETIKEEDLAFITEDERSEAKVKQEEVESKKANRPFEAQVKVVQMTRSKGEASGKRFPFVDNKVTVIHTLRKYPTDENPAWKIYSSEVAAAQFMVAQN